MVLRELRALRVGAVVVSTLWLLGACGSCGTSTAASGVSQADLAAAVIDGHWKLTVVVQPYTGPPPPSTNPFPSGHRGVDEVVFVSTCVTAGSCMLQLWGASGPVASQASYYRFYSSVTELEGPPVSTPMPESGASYSQTIPISGFGGYKCPPPTGAAKPEQRLTLTVTDAKAAGSGWTATKMTGTETFIDGWGCGASTGWTVGHLSIAGQPS
jgi:hypothetical protein